MFRQGPYRFYFFSLEEDRMHVHIDSPGGRRAKCGLSLRKRWRTITEFRAREVTKILRIVEERRGEIEKRRREHPDIEVASLSRHGFWLYLDGRELFVSFKEFPWFAEAPVNKIVNVHRPSADPLLA